MKAKAESRFIEEVTLTMTMEEAIALNSYLVNAGTWEGTEAGDAANKASDALDEVEAYSDFSKYRVVE